MSGFPQRRYAAAPDFTLPDLVEHELVESIETTSDVAEDTRYDTASQHLQRAGMDLYRRKDASGGTWHLSLDAGAAVIAFDSKATQPPREASALLTAVRGGQRLVAVERVRAEWDVHELQDGGGEAIATIHDTVVTRSHPAGEFETEVWREVEVGFDDSVAKETRKAVHKGLKSHGAKEVAKSRLDQAGRQPAARSSRKGLGGLVDNYLQDQLQVLAFGDFDLRRDAGDPVHATRVAIRRLRSTLHVFADVFDPARADALSDELSWFAGLLGEIRDADVGGRRLEKLFDTADDSLATASARRHFEDGRVAIATAAYDALTNAMNGRRYAALVGLLENWRIEPPYLKAAEQPSKAARGYVTTTTEKLRKRLRTATKKSADVDDLHRARKVAKRLRYASELAAPALPKGGKSTRKEGHRWQRSLGEIQDLRITSELIELLGSTSPSPQDAFVFGVLWDQAQDRSRRSYAALVRKVR